MPGRRWFSRCPWFSAVPPTAYEWGGGHFGHAEQLGFLGESLMVAGLDEVMDWPAVWNPENPSHDRLWGMIEATFERRGVIEGHAAGIRDMATINAFAAAGLASDHEAWTAEEVLDKLRRGLFMELRPHSLTEMVKGLLAAGLGDWSHLALTTDDRSCSDTLRLGATDHNLRLAIEAGLPPEVAIQMVTINPARHMRWTPGWAPSARGRLRRSRIRWMTRTGVDRQGTGRMAIRWRRGPLLKPVAAHDHCEGRRAPWGSTRPEAEDFEIPRGEGRKTIAGGAGARSTGTTTSSPWSFPCGTGPCSATRIAT